MFEPVQAPEEGHHESDRRDSSASQWRGWTRAIVLCVGVALLFTGWLMRGRWTSGGQPAPAVSSGQSFLNESLAHYQAGRYAEAVTAAQAAAAADPASVEALNNLAVSLMQLRRFDEAIQTAEKAVQLRPDYALARNNLAWIRNEQAKVAGGAAPAPSPAVAQANALLNESLGHAQAGRFQQCVEAAERATKLAPELAGAYNNLGFCAGRLGRWDEAVVNLERAVRLNPADPLARNNLAQAITKRAETAR
jgi:protein O-GlcNAc transferase